MKLFIQPLGLNDSCEHVTDSFRVQTPAIRQWIHFCVLLQHKKQSVTGINVYWWWHCQLNDLILSQVSRTLNLHTQLETLFYHLRTIDSEECTWGYSRITRVGLRSIPMFWMVMRGKGGEAWFVLIHGHTKLELNEWWNRTALLETNKDSIL